MKKLTVFLILLYLFAFSHLALANLEKISTIGQAEKELQLNKLIIEFNITAQGSNQSQLERDLKEIGEKIKTELSEKQELTRENINFKESGLKNSGNGQRSWQKNIAVKITLDEVDSLENRSLTKDIIDRIKELDPAQQRVRYNVRTEIKFIDYLINLTLNDPQAKQDNLIKEALNNSALEAQAIANHLNINNFNLIEIRKKNSSGLLNFKQRYTLNQLDNLKFKHNFTLELEAVYLSN